MDRGERYLRMIHIKAGVLRSFIKKVLLKIRVRGDVASYVTEGLVQTSLRGVDSHGVRLFPHYLEGVKKGRINPNPKYKFIKTAESTGVFDADHTFGHAAGIEAAKHAIRLAKRAGTGHVAVCNSTHFGAAAYYVLEIAKHDMIGLAFTNTDALIKTYAGKRPFLGNNPIAFAAPCEDEEPFCLDMATSIVTFNKIRQCREKRVSAPKGIGADKNGIETTDPRKMTMLLPIGGYKGYGLSMMIEVLSSLLSGMPYGPHIPKMFEAPMSAKRFLGHFMIAINIDCFQEKNVFKKRLALMMKELRGEPPFNKKVPVEVAGDPEKKNYSERIRNGIPMGLKEYEIFKRMGDEHGVPFNGERK
jgi:ureidoglycolate dehydrogenase (NAD+)